VTSVPAAWSYKLIREFSSSRNQSEIQAAVRNSSGGVLQRDVVQKEFNMWAIIIDCNCKEVWINPIIKSRTHCYYSHQHQYMTVLQQRERGKYFDQTPTSDHPASAYTHISRMREPPFLRYKLRNPLTKFRPTLNPRLLRPPARIPLSEVRIYSELSNWSVLMDPVHWRPSRTRRALTHVSKNCGQCEISEQRGAICRESLRPVINAYFLSCIQQVWLKSRRFYRCIWELQTFQLYSAVFPIRISMLF
jgi:hypothetical protein